MTDSSKTAIVMAGVPATNKSLYHRTRFLVGDPVALIEIGEEGNREKTLILRDIELQRARQYARADRMACPADFAPVGGLSGDRETATAQAAAECLRRAGVQHVVADRTLPLIFVHEIQLVGIEVRCDTELGVLERRAKDEREIECLQRAQRVTEDAMEMACTMIGTAHADRHGLLMKDGAPLTSERVRSELDIWLLQRGYTNPTSIVAGGPAAADCHYVGSGPLFTEQPVIIDIFPCDRKTLYNGDCTRTVVHGQVPDQIFRMHIAVVKAKAAAISAVWAGVWGHDVHQAAIAIIQDRGYRVGLPDDSQPDTYCAMTHGTGHGIGLDVHEPPLLDYKGPELVAGDVLTIEPGLYSRALGGVRVEDMVVVMPRGCQNLNRLHEGLQWN